MGGWVPAPGGAGGRLPAFSGASRPSRHGGAAGVLPHCQTPRVIRPRPAEAVAASPIGLGVPTAPPSASSSVVLRQDKRREGSQETRRPREAPGVRRGPVPGSAEPPDKTRRRIRGARGRRRATGSAQDTRCLGGGEQAKGSPSSELPTLPSPAAPAGSDSKLGSPRRIRNRVCLAQCLPRDRGKTGTSSPGRALTALTAACRGCFEPWPQGPQLAGRKSFQGPQVPSGSSPGRGWEAAAGTIQAPRTARFWAGALLGWARAPPSRPVSQLDGP